MGKAARRPRPAHSQVRIYEETDFLELARLYLLTFPFLSWNDAIEALPGRPGPTWVIERAGRLEVALITDADGALTLIADPATARLPELGRNFQELARAAALHHLPAGGYLRVVFSRALSGVSDALKSAGVLSTEFLRLHVVRFTAGGEGFALN